MFLLTSVLNIRAVSQGRKPIIIGIDGNGTRIVTEASDPIYKTEAIAFIRKFFYNAYNFNTSNFFKRIGLATTMMSENLWKKKESEILDLKSKVERDNIEISGEIVELSKEENGLYHALIKIKEKTRLNEQNHEMMVSVRLKPVTRTSDNPFGLEVDSYEETPTDR